MGLYDRDYMSDKKAGSGFRSWSAVTWLMVICAGSYLVQHLLFDNNIRNSINLSWDGIRSGEVWRFLTFQFCHANLYHFLGNMVFLFFGGRIAEQVLGSRLIVPLYLVGGLIGGLLQAVLFTGSSVVGASASVMAVVTAMIVTIPEQPISLLFIPVRFRIKYLGWGLLAINLLGLVFSFSPTGQSEISYIAHLGGMVVGWGYVKFYQPASRRRQVRKENRSRAGGNRKRSITSKITDAAEERIREKREKESVYLNKRVDAILEKISAEGMQSLSEEERKILERSSEKLSRKLGDKS